MKAEQTEIARLQREGANFKMERDIFKKCCSEICEGIDVKFDRVAKHRGKLAVESLCEALDFSRSGFYAWLKRPRSARSLTDRVL